LHDCHCAGGSQVHAQFAVVFTGEQYTENVTQLRKIPVRKVTKQGKPAIQPCDADDVDVLCFPSATKFRSALAQVHHWTLALFLSKNFTANPAIEARLRHDNH
jgi:hypothetical protein